MRFNYENHDKLATQLKELMAEDESLKSDLFQVWRNNIDFVNGQQLAYWDTSKGRFSTRTIPLNDSKRISDDYIVVTNEINPIVRVLVSFYTRNRPAAKVYPTDHKSEDSVMRAKIAENIQQAKWVADDEYLKHYEAKCWEITTGTVFREDTFNPKARGKRMKTEEEIGQEESEPLPFGENLKVKPFLQEVSKLEAQENPEAAKEMEDSSPPEDNTVHWGDTESNVLTPFQMAVDHSAKDRDFDWIEKHELKDVDWVKANFNKRGKGYTGRAMEVTATEDFGNALEYDLEMRFRSQWNSASKPKSKNMCLMRYFYQAPKWYMPWNKGANEEVGSMVIMANEVVLYVGPTPYQFKERFHPFTYNIYEPFLGRFWGKSLVEELIPLQMRLNEINGAIVKNGKTLAKGKWKYLKGTVIEGAFSGREDEPLEFEADPVAGVVAPVREGGVSLPAQFFNERQILIDAMARISGSNTVMQGVPPTGISAAAALQLLLENANSQHGTGINRWETFIEEGQTLKLQIFQKFCREPREDLYQYIQRIDKSVTSLGVDFFTGEKIEDNVSVDIEAGSSIPKSQAARQNQLMEFAKMGVIGDVVNDPITRQQFLKEFGLTEFDQTNNVEWEKVQWENGLMLKGKDPFPSEFDVHELHAKGHTTEFKKPSFIENASEQVKAKVFEHIKWHQSQMAQAQQSQSESEKSQASEALNMQAEKEGKIAEMKEMAKANAKKDEMEFENELENPFLSNVNQNVDPFLARINQGGAPIQESFGSLQ